MEKRTAPKWSVPVPKCRVNLPPLKLYNSLSNSKEPFVPIRGKHVSWYCCGPTVYDSSHMGHARSYISFDIIRRVLSDYFGFKVNYVMNITDIDDKIIKKARQNYLIEGYFKNVQSLLEVKNDIRAAILMLEEKSKTHPDPDQRDYLKREATRLRMLLTARISVTSMLTGAQDALASYLDYKYGSSISDYKIFESLPRRMEEEFLNDMKALNVLEADKLTRVSEYIQPIIEYIQKIIGNGFAYAVESGSVYFNTKKFADTDGHFYAKLMPTAYGDVAKLESGEGDLSLAETEKRTFSDFALWKASKPGEPAWPSPWGQGRPGWHIECSVMASDAIGDSMDIHTGGIDLKFPHHDNELAQSEAYFGHSHWVSYFLHAGHLTISGCKMSKSLKNFITIRDALKQHSARDLRFAFLLHSWRDTLDYGADTMNQALAFSKLINDFLFNVSHTLRLLSSTPDVDASISSNEDLSMSLAIAQREVYHALCDSIDTRRAMSAIRELINASNQAECTNPIVSSSPQLIHRAYQSYTVAAFILRLLQMFGAADNTNVATSWSIIGTEELDTVPISLNHVIKAATKPVWVSMEAPKIETLTAALHGAALACSQFVCDVRDIVGNVSAVSDILYTFEDNLKNEFNLHLKHLSDDAGVTFMGTLRHAIGDENRLKSVTDDAHSSAMEQEVWPIVARLLYTLADLRQSVRGYAQSSAARTAGLNGRLLEACDKLRDDYLPCHGIRLQDRTDGITTDKTELPAIGLVDARVLAADKREKVAREAQKAELKAKKLQAKEEAGRQSPSDMFRSQTDKYSAFDEKGMPTHDLTGKEITKSQLKKLQKLYDAQAKRHEAFIATQCSS